LKIRHNFLKGIKTFLQGRKNYLKGKKFKNLCPEKLVSTPPKIHQFSPKIQLIDVKVSLAKKCQNPRLCFSYLFSSFAENLMRKIVTKKVGWTKSRIKPL
jgi:hypothetical protein